MALLVPNASEASMLLALLNNTAPQDQYLKLYTNNYTPVVGSIASNFTEAAGNGYAAITLAGASWSTSGGNPTSANFAQQTFTFTGALGNVYGYFVVQKTSGLLLWAELFSNGPYNIQNNGDQIKITPTLTLT